MITDKGMHEIKKTNTRQEVERILPAEIIAYHLQAGNATLHRILLVIKEELCHSLYSLFFIEVFPLYLVFLYLNNK